MSDRSELMLRMTHSLARLAPEQSLPQRLCQAFVHVTEARSGAIAVGFTTTERALLCATSEAAARYEDAQDLVQEGPSLDAFRTGAIITSRSLADQRSRWPRLADVVDGLPAQAVHAIPMRPETSVVGVLTVHHDLTAALSRSEPELQFLTGAVGAAIIGDLPDPEERGSTWSERDRVSQATGMVIAQLELDARDALAVLRAHAYAQESSLHEVSRLVIARDLDFTVRPEEERT